MLLNTSATGHVGIVMPQDSNNKLPRRVRHFGIEGNPEQAVHTYMAERERCIMINQFGRQQV